MEEMLNHDEQVELDARMMSPRFDLAQLATDSSIETIR